MDRTLIVWIYADFSRYDLYLSPAEHADLRRFSRYDLDLHIDDKRMQYTTCLNRVRILFYHGA